jgi:hypothetical protein
MVNLLVLVPAPQQSRDAWSWMSSPRKAPLQLTTLQSLLDLRTSATSKKTAIFPDPPCLRDEDQKMDKVYGDHVHQEPDTHLSQGESPMMTPFGRSACNS